MAENEKEQLKKFIHQLPNAVNGDGKAFVAQLKKALSYLSEHAGGSGGGEDSGEGEDAINQVTALRLTEVHTVDSSGFPKNNIEVTFDNSNIENYAFAQVWVKDDTENTYQQHGNTNGTRYLFENALVGRTYTVKVVVQLKDGRTSNFDNAPTASILIQGSVLIPDAPTQFFLTWDDDGALWQWQYEENEYIDFFELRLDANAGVYNDKLLDRTRLPYSRVTPNVRSGTAYLFIRNVFGDYSTPATHIFNKPVGVKPNKPVLQATLDGVVITMSPLPTGYQGYILEIDGEEFKTINRQFVYYKFSGTVKARYCYYDEIGRGEWSEYESITIKVTLEPDELPEISYDAFDQTIKDAIDGANAQKNINKQLQDSIKDLMVDVDEAIGDVNNKIDTSVSGVQADIDGILTDLNKNAVNSPFTSIKQTADGISVLSAEITEVGDKVETNASNIALTNNKVESLVFKVDEVDTQSKTNASNITQTANSITSLVYEQVNALDSKINTNTSKITQTANDIETLVANEVETLNGKIATNASQIAQSANKIETLVVSIDDLERTSQTNASSIKQTADNVTVAVSKINQLEKDVAENTASISITDGKINSVVSGLNGSAGDSGYQALTGLASSITQTNSSITSVVTELNKEPDQCAYTAINQLLEGVLIIAGIAFNGEYIVSFINVAPEGITINGNRIHITGDTWFDDNVIAGGYIKADAISTNHLQTNAITTDKIASNAITADKIKAGSITTEKITDKSVSSVKIEDGAITVAKIEDGAVGSTKIEGGAITTEHIQAGSIIGEHISAGAISADKLYAGDIDMTGKLALVGGAVRLDKNGLKVTRRNGSYTVFDGVGINYYDRNGTKHATVSRMMVGTAKHNDYVRFDSPWDIVPSVIVIPMTIKTGVEDYTTEQLSVNYYATDITKEGFRVQAYTVVDTLKGYRFIHDYFADTSTVANQNGEYIITDIPPSATQVKIKLEFYRTGSTGRDRSYYAGVSAGVYVNNNLVNSFAFTDDFRNEENLFVGSMSDGSFNRTDTVVAQVSFKQGDEIKVTAYARNIYGGWGYANALVYSLEFNTGDEEIIATGTASFIVSDSISSAYTIERGS